MTNLHSKNLVSFQECYTQLQIQEEKSEAEINLNSI